MRFVGSVVLILMLATLASATTLTGVVVDASTGDPIEGATLSFAPTSSYVAVTDARGRFEFDQQPPLGSTISVRHVGYWGKEFRWTEAITSPVRIELKPRAYKGEGVTYSIDRVERETATVPYSNISEDEVELRHFAQDLPVALEGIPSLTTTTDAGSGLGYSYLNLRGFDFRRVSVLLNGVMLNDPEDFYVYWVDLADFGANVQDVQVQRGAGSALLGLPAVGGTIDVRTSTFSDQPALSAEYGLGSYNTQRASVHLQSGAIQNKYFFDGRFSRVQSDGYRDDAWSDYMSYYLSGARVDETMTTRVVLFGGPIQNHQAYAGIPRAQAETDRTANPLSYPELGSYQETDNFYQPHYQLHHDWDISENVHLKNTLYYIRGEGYFNVHYPPYWGYGWYFWDLPEPDSGEMGTMIARQWVENHQGGWQPRLTWTVNNHTVDVGGQVISHRSRRWGELAFGETLPAGTNPDHVWYDYQGRKRVISGYVQDKWRLTDRLSLTGAVQVANIEYEVLNNKRFGTEFSQPYTFVMPRLGASWRTTDQLRLWGSISQITREPRLKDHYWGETGYPVIRYNDPVNFEDPQINPETLLDLELGAEWSNSWLFAGLTGYWMRVQDEIVDIGAYDVLGQPVIENADETRRLGIEASARVRMNGGWFAEGNITLSRNRFEEYMTTVTVIDDNFVAYPMAADLSGNQIINAPELMGNLAVGIHKPEYRVRLSAHHVGERFVANTEGFEDVNLVPLTDDVTFDPNSSATTKQDRSLDAYTRVDLDASIRLLGNERLRGLITRVGAPSVELDLHVRNLFDSEYNMSGSADPWGVYVIPAATRHFYAGVKVTL